MRRLTTIAEVRAAVASAHAAGQRVGLVATMGALHAGHLALVRRCAELAPFRVVSVFVNPTQFGPEEDLAAYPRDLEGDEDALASLGRDAPDVVFAPRVEEVYPGERLTTVTVARLTEPLCGATRPGHFDGVTTVVAKLLNIVGPDVAVFGRKDFQQLTVIRRMVTDLDVPVEIAAGTTVREDDGVAMSSRNRYLGGEDRQAARALSRALRSAVEAARAARADGQPVDAEMLRAAAGVTLRAEPRIRIDYLDVLDPEELAPPDAMRGHGAARAGMTGTSDGDGGPQRLLVALAAYVGEARLIDNVVVGDLEDEDRLLAATGG